MRAIKFRAWNPDSKTMIYLNPDDGEWFVLSAQGYWNFCDQPDGSISYVNNLENDDAILMQYTNLKDNQGKEIYEGDVVKRIGDFGTIQYPDLKELIDVVEFKGACFMPICEEPMENFEIIGNIYENPELIENR